MAFLSYKISCQEGDSEFVGSFSRLSCNSHRTNKQFQAAHTNPFSTAIFFWDHFKPGKLPTLSLGLSAHGNAEEQQQQQWPTERYPVEARSAIEALKSWNSGKLQVDNH